MPTTSTQTDQTKSTSPAATQQGKEHPAGATQSSPKVPVRIAVRERKPGEILSAYQLVVEDTLILPSGHGVRAFPSDWVICRNDKVVDVMAESRFQTFYAPLGEPDFVLAPEDRTALEKALGFGSTRDSVSLRRAVEHVANLTIGDIKVNFSVSQWEEIARRAEKRRMTITTYVDQLVQRLCQDIWTSAI